MRTSLERRPVHGSDHVSVSRSALFVAACRALADELPPTEVIVTDPYARALVDEQALTQARADPAMQRVMQLRTRFIDDRVIAFAATRPDAQVVLLGAGLDTRPIRLDITARFFEIDFPATLDHKISKLGAHTSRSITIGADLRHERLTEILPRAGFDTSAPTIVVWEGVINYLSASADEQVVHQMGSVLAPGGQLVADYVEMSWFRGAEFERSTAGMAQRLSAGGEPLRGGLPDAHGTLRSAGFDVIDDASVELLPPRYGAALRPRCYPGRILTAVRVE